MNSNIAVGVNKAGKIWAGHFGQAPYYYIYNSNGELIDKKINPHGAGQGHGHNHDDNQPILIKEILSDCKTFIGRRMGEGSKLKLAEKLGIETVLTEIKEPQEAVEQFLKGELKG